MIDKFAAMQLHGTNSLPEIVATFAAFLLLHYIANR